MLDVARHEDGVATVTMRRPDKRNAMGAAFFRDLIAAMTELPADESVGAIVIAGEGPVFSAGGDIAEFPPLADDPTRARAHIELALAAFGAVERAAVPVVAAVGGPARGGGVELILACDWVVAADTADFALPEVRLGLLPAYGLREGFAKLGRGWTLRMASTGEAIDAPTAERIGLVHEVVPAAEVDGRARLLASAMAAGPAAAIRAAKAQVLPDARPDAVDATADLFARPEARASVERFLSR